MALFDRERRRKLVQIPANLPEEAVKDIKRIAEKEGIRQNAVVRQLLLAALRLYKANKLDGLVDDGD